MGQCDITGTNPSRSVLSGSVWDRIRCIPEWPFLPIEPNLPPLPLSSITSSGDSMVVISHASAIQISTKATHCIALGKLFSPPQS